MHIMCPGFFKILEFIVLNINTSEHKYMLVEVGNVLYHLFLSCGFSEIHRGTFTTALYYSFISANLIMFMSTLPQVPASIKNV